MVTDTDDVRDFTGTLHARTGTSRSWRCLLRVTGEMDGLGLLRLQQRCTTEMALGATSIVLDFTEMTACPGALFTVLADTSRAFRRNAVELRLVGLVEAVRAIACDDVGPPGRTAALRSG